jgi:hypothetical protein
MGGTLKNETFGCMVAAWGQWGKRVRSAAASSYAILIRPYGSRWCGHQTATHRRNIHLTTNNQCVNFNPEFMFPSLNGFNWKLFTFLYTS